jgi:hypothetical protein
MLNNIQIRPNIHDTNEIINKTKKIKNIIFAISAAPAAMPVKPNRPATSEIIRNTTTQLNMVVLLFN